MDLAWRRERRCRAIPSDARWSHIDSSCAMTLIGELSLWLALVLSVWSTAVSYAGGTLRRRDLVESGVRGLYATFAMIALASAGLWTALLTRDFSLDYVASQISQNTPAVYAFTAFWSGQAGSLLFWALLLS